jgi:hypothetical protein
MARRRSDVSDAVARSVLVFVAQGRLKSLEAVRPCRILDVITHEPTLEDIFLWYTGSRLMGGPPRSVLGRALFDQRRSIGWWAVGIAGFVVLLVLYWPSIRDQGEDL